MDTSPKLDLHHILSAWDNLFPRLKSKTEFENILTKFTLQLRVNWKNYSIISSENTEKNENTTCFSVENRDSNSSEKVTEHELQPATTSSSNVEEVANCSNKPSYPVRSNRNENPEYSVGSSSKKKKIADAMNHFKAFLNNTCKKSVLIKFIAENLIAGNFTKRNITEADIKNSIQLNGLLCDLNQEKDEVNTLKPGVYLRNCLNLWRNFQNMILECPQLKEYKDFEMLKKFHDLEMLNFILKPGRSKKNSSIKTYTQYLSQFKEKLVSASKTEIVQTNLKVGSMLEKRIRLGAYLTVKFLREWLEIWIYIRNEKTYSFEKLNRRQLGLVLTQLKKIGFDPKKFNDMNVMLDIYNGKMDVACLFTESEDSSSKSNRAVDKEDTSGDESPNGDGSSQHSESNGDNDIHDDKSKESDSSSDHPNPSYQDDTSGDESHIGSSSRHSISNGDDGIHGNNRSSPSLFEQLEEKGYVLEDKVVPNDFFEETELKNLFAMIHKKENRICQVKNKLSLLF